MITEYHNLNNGNKLQVAQKNLQAIQAELEKFGQDLSGVLGMSLVSFGPIDIDLTINTLTTINHGLGYHPVFLSYFYESSGQFFYPIQVIDYGNAYTGLENRQPATVLMAWVDEYNLYIDWKGSAQTPQQQLFYFIFGAAIK